MMATSLPRLDVLYVGTLPPHRGGSALSCGQLLVGIASLGHRVRAVAPISDELLEAAHHFAARHPELSVTRYVVPYDNVDPMVPLPEEYRALERAQLSAIIPTLIADRRPDIVFIGRESFVHDVPGLIQEFDLPSLVSLRGGTTIGMLNGAYPASETAALLEQLRSVDLLVSPARHLAERARALGLSQIEVIPNAIDLEQFCPRPKDTHLQRELGIGDDDVVVAHVSNLKSLKRPLDVVASAERVLRKRPRVRYLIVGDGPGRRELEACCQASGIADRCTFTGWLEYERLPALLNVVDVVLMPAEDEALARVYLETQACGRVLLASDIPAASEVIRPGETGLLFRKGDLDDMTEKLLLAADDEQLRAAIGERARARVMVHSLDRAVSSYVAAMRDILQRRHGAATTPGRCPGAVQHSA